MPTKERPTNDGIADSAKGSIRKELAELKMEVGKMKEKNKKLKTEMEERRQSVLTNPMDEGLSLEAAPGGTDLRVRSLDGKKSATGGSGAKSLSTHSKAKSSYSNKTASSDHSVPSTVLDYGPRRSRKSIIKPPGKKSGSRKKFKRKVKLPSPRDSGRPHKKDEKVVENQTPVPWSYGDGHKPGPHERKTRKTRYSQSKAQPRKSLTDIFREKIKVRGRVAKPIKMLNIFRFLGHTYTMMILELFVSSLYYLYFHLVLYVTTFDFGNAKMDKFFTFCDVVFIGDLFYRLFIQFIRHVADLDYTLTLVPCTLRFWLFHTICLAPFEWLANFLAISFDKMNVMALSPIGRFNRIGLLYRVWSFISILDEEQYLSQKTSFLIAFYLLYFAFVQVIACILFAITPATPPDHFLQRVDSAVAASWLGKSYITTPGIIPGPVNNYIMSLSFATSMVTTVGYGDPAPKTENEMVVGIMAMLFGAIALAGWFGSIFTGFLLARDTARYELFHRAEVIQSHLKKLGASALFAEKTREFYECLWNFREGVYKVEMIRLLPSSMNEDIIFDICSEMFHKTLMFRGLDEPFLRAVSHTVEVLMYNPEMILCLQGEKPTCMFYIIQGECIAKTRHSSNQTSAILRPGCVFGEASLFFSFPHTTNIETRTCCQLLVIHKTRLREIVDHFPDSLAVMRARMRARTAKLLGGYQIHGRYPVMWTTRKVTHGHSITTQVFPDYPMTVRWADGFNRKVPYDLVETAELPVIVEMACLNEEFANDEINTYGTCVLPVTLTLPGIHFWHIGVLLLGVPYFTIVVFTTLVDLAIVQGPSQSLLEVVESFDVLVSIVYGVDLLVEIFTATPSSGLIHYKFTDGFRVKSRQWSFYVDVYSLVPYINLKKYGKRLRLVHEINNAVHVIFGRGFKIVLRVARYFNFLNEKYPKSIFFVRVLESVVSLVLHGHVLACLLFSLACPRPSFVNLQEKKIRACNGFNWLNSFYTRTLLSGAEPTDDITPNGIVNRNPYLLSMYFAIATWSSAGYGDFVPQNLYETIVLITVQLWGFYVIGNITAKLTSALTCISIAQINFEKKLQSMRIFFDLHGFTMRLRDRITEHYKLQYHYNDGVQLPEGVHHLMYDAPPYLAEDALYAEMSVHLDGVPIFNYMDPTLLVHMAMLVKRYVLPPNIIFIHRGDVRREMYIVKSGSVAVLKEDTTEVKAVLEETGHFGVRDLLYGEPSFSNVMTLSYCVLYAIDYSSFNAACGHDTILLTEIEEHKGRLEERIELLNLVYKNAAKAWETKAADPTQIPSWIRFPTKKQPISKVCTIEEFDEAFNTVACGCFLRRFLMRRAVHPAGNFALFWCLLTASTGLLFILIFMLEYLLEYSSLLTQLTILGSKAIFLMDIYVRMHWGFYTELNYLVCHPVYTAKHYLLEGPFIYSLFLETVEYSISLYFLSAVNVFLQGEGERWDIKLQLVRLAHLFRLPIFFQFGHNVSRHRTKILLFIYVMLTLSLCSLLACVALHFACPLDQAPYSASNMNKVRACLRGRWTDTKETLQDDLNIMWKRWVISIYYISQTVLVIGYGDMVTLDRTEIIQLCVMMLFGFVVTRCIIADFSAFIISEDSLRAEYLEQMNRITTVMRKQEVNKKLIDIVDQHLQHTWLMCKGLQPRRLLRDLHPALQSDLFREYIGDSVATVPLWHGLNDCIIRTLCTYMTKLYFTRGERIARKGNLEFEMYVIVEGNVWITGHRLQYKCTLGPRETFGEAQMMYGIIRGYSAVAANNVEVFALNAVDFAQILDHYPDLKTDMEENMGWVPIDLFEKKVNFFQETQKMAGDVELIRKAEERITGIIQDAVTKREIDAHFDCTNIENSSRTKRFIRDYLYDWGPNDAHLPFFYLATPQRASKPRFLIHPKCGFYYQFSRLVVIVSISSAVLGMYMMVFTEGPANGPFHVAKTEPYYIMFPIASYIMDLIYVIHIVLQFFVPFPTVEGKFCKERKRIFYRYTRSISRFWLDLFSTTPLEFYGQTMVTSVHNFQFSNLIRSLRLINFYRSLNESYENIHVTTFRYNIISSVTSFFLMAHALAILFYFVSHCQVDLNVLASTTASQTYCKDGTWTAYFINDFLEGVNTPPTEVRAWRWYIRSLYWVVTTISTTGFGDIVAHTLPEITISIICIFCGAFILAYILSLFTSGITSLTRHYRDYTYHLEIVSRYLGNLGLSSAWQSSLIEWFLYRWKISRGTSFSSAVNILPLSLQTTVNMALYQETISKVPLFKDIDPRFFRALVSFVDHIVYLPGQIIENEGNHGNHLFIVAKGRVSGYNLNRHGQPKLIRWYDEGNCFGRIPAFFYDEVYTKTYRAEVDTEILTVNKHALFYLARYFQDFEKRLQSYIAVSYDPDLGTDTFFSPSGPKLSRVGFFGRGLGSAGVAPAKRSKGTNTKVKVKRIKKKYIVKKNMKLLVSKNKQSTEEGHMEAKTRQLLDAYATTQEGEEDSSVKSGSMKSAASKQDSIRSKRKETGGNGVHTDAPTAASDGRMYQFDAETEIVGKINK